MKRPRVKQPHFPVKISDRRIRIGSVQYGVGAVIEDDAEGHIWKLLGLMDGTRDEQSIVSSMLTDDPKLDQQSIRDAMKNLIEGGFIEDCEAKVPAELSAEEVIRYDRNTQYFSWVDISPRSSPYEYQRLLKKSKVVVLGMGGTGMAVSSSLVAAGVGSILCVDFDKVEEPNLNRQVLYKEEDIGKSKAKAAVERLRQLNHYVRVEGVDLRVKSAEDAQSLMRNCDLFFRCVDNIETNEWINLAALYTRTPWIYCGYDGPMIVVGLFIPHETPCYMCFRHQQEVAATAHDGAEVLTLTPRPDINAVIAPSANLGGQLAALEGLYFLTGLPTQTRGRLFHQNLVVYDHTYYVDFPFWGECPACRKSDPTFADATQAHKSWKTDKEQGA